jgi:hypothetical protein
MVTNATDLQAGDLGHAGAWPVVLRAVLAASFLAIAVAYALRSFIHASDGVIVVVVAAGAALLGRALPAVELPLFDWIPDDSDSVDAV